MISFSSIGSLATASDPRFRIFPAQAAANKVAFTINETACVMISFFVVIIETLIYGIGFKMTKE